MSTQAVRHSLLHLFLLKSTRCYRISESLLYICLVTYQILHCPSYYMALPSANIHIDMKALMSSTLNCLMYFSSWSQRPSLICILVVMYIWDVYLLVKCVIKMNWYKKCVSKKNRDVDSIWRWHLTRIVIPIMEIRRSYDHLISTMGFLIQVRCHLYIESGSRAPPNIFSQIKASRPTSDLFLAMAMDAWP